MRRYLCCVLLVIFSAHGSGSLAQSQHAWAASDTQRVRILIEEGNAFAGADGDSAAYFLDQAMALSNKIDYTVGVVKSLAAKGRLSSATGAYKDALLFFTQAIPLYDAYTARDRNRVYTGVYNSIGSAYQSLGNFNKAGNYYIKAAGEASKDSSLNNLRAYIYSSLGGVFIQLGQPEKAIGYFNSAQHLASAAKDYHTLGYVLSNKGVYYEETNQLDSAELTYKTALELSEQYNDERTVLTCLNNLGALQMKREHYKEAIPYFEKTLALTKGNLYLRVNGPLYFLGVANYYLGNYKKAEDFLVTALKEANETGQSEMNMDVHNILAMVYAAKSDYRNAYAHQKIYERMKDSLSGIEAANNVNALETKYRTAEKDRQIAEKKLQIAKQEVNIQKKTALVWIFSSAGLLLLGLLGLLYRSYRQRQKLHKERLRTLQQEKEIELLQAMMEGEERERIRIAHELHDGISSQVSAMKVYLSTIKNQHKELNSNHEFQQVVNMLNETANDIRKTAHNLMPESLTRQGLAAAARSFCEQITNGGKTTVEFQAYGDFNDLQGNLALLLYRIIQELLNNIVKHAEATQAIILLYREGDKLQLTVEDNGVGISHDDKEEGGLGLASLEAKVRSLNGIFSVETLENKGTTIYIELQISEEKKNLNYENSDSHYR